MMMAALSLGPVGIADPLSETTLPGQWAQPVWPANTTITSNVSIVRAAVSLNGSLLQPSYPITPSAATLQRLPNSRGWSVWSTYTSVPIRSATERSAERRAARGTGVMATHFTAVGFVDETASSSEATGDATPAQVRAHTNTYTHTHTHTLSLSFSVFVCVHPHTLFVSG